MTLPRALDPFVGFAQVLRRAGFAVAPDQTVAFIEAVGLLGPDNLRDVHRAALALFAIPPEGREAFDALFRAVFLGQIGVAPTETPDEGVEAYEATGQVSDAQLSEDDSEAGSGAVVTERLGHRAVDPDGESAALSRLSRLAADRLPRRLSYRRRGVPSGNRPDLRRTLREAAKRDGEVFRLFETRRKTRQRRVLLLIDVSGSMQDRSAAALRLAHTLVQAADRAEVFTLGTRLTRVTPALAPADRHRALARAAALVADIDGGTRLGDALAAFLAVPRFAGMARGAAVIVLSDGLERSGPEALIDAVGRLRRIAWRLDWLTPLAADPGFRPETAALRAIAPLLDTLGDGSSTVRVTEHILNLARAS